MMDWGGETQWQAGVEQITGIIPAASVLAASMIGYIIFRSPQPSKRRRGWKH